MKAQQLAIAARFMQTWHVCMKNHHDMSHGKTVGPRTREHAFNQTTEWMEAANDPKKPQYLAR
jgi:hypothetical protein